MQSEWKNRGLWAKTLYSLNGLRSALLTEKAVRQEFSVTVLAVGIAIFMKRPWGDVLEVFLISLIPPMIELINTAVERFIDYQLGPAYRDEVRIDKDMLSASVFLAMTIS